MFKKVFFIISIVFIECSLNHAILSTEKNKESINKLFSARHLGQSIVQCFGNNEKMNCLENEMLKILDKAIQSNETWQFSDFLVIQKNSKISDKDLQKFQNISASQQQRQQRSLSDSLALKMLQLAQRRSLKLQLPSSLTSLFSKGDGISSALDEFITTPVATNTEGGTDANPSAILQQDEGTQRILNGLVDDKIALISSSRIKQLKKQKPSYSYSLTSVLPSLSTTSLTDKNKIWSHKTKPPKGRKKKDKDKNMAMLGGMAMLTMVAQLFLGKVILIAGAAFAMAKIALLISVLGSIKKETSGSSGTTEHVIVTDGGASGGHSHEYSSGWHRSMPNDYNKLQNVAADQHKHTDPVTYFAITDNNELQRRQVQHNNKLL